MISPIAKISTPSMKRTSLSIALLLVIAQVRLFSQESATAGQAVADAPVPSPTPGLLTPPPDNAPVQPAPAATTTTTTTTTKTTSTSSEMSPREIARVQQQEIIRRQELIFRANQAVSAARKAELASDFPEARKNYLFSAEAYGSISRSTSSYATAADGLTRVDFQLYDAALKIGDTARAKLLIDEVIKYNPNNKDANVRLAAINRVLANPNDTSLIGNPAVTPRFVQKVNEVQDLFAQAEQYRRTGQWDLAEARLKRILGIDPYNIAATKQLERIEAEKNQYFDSARIQTRDERLRQVEEKWYEPINNKDATTTHQEDQPDLVRSTNFDLDQMLHSIMVSLNFDSGTTIEQATNFLSVESKRLDPNHKGVNFIIQPNASTQAKPIALTLNNVPLSEALRYVCQLANVKYKVQDYAISIVPFNADTNDLISRTFVVPPNFVAAPSAGGTIASATAGLGGARPIAPVGGTAPTTDANEGDTVRQALEAKGLKFPAGASAVYSPTTGQLTVVDTADQMELLEELVQAGHAPTLMVRIATKFVEINQDDLNDLTINTAFNFWNPQTLVTSNGQFHTPSYSTALPGSLAFSPNSIDQLISPQTNNFNSLNVRSIIQTAQFNVVVSALSQKKSFDLLSEPAVLTKSGEQGVLEAVRVFPYPIAFDPPQLQTVQNNNNNGGGVVVVAFTPPTVIATTPTDFKRRNIGVRLVIKPLVTADNRTVDLNLFPEVTDFDGFVNYGSPISIANPDGTQSLLSNNEINQPVFNTRRITTRVLIRDGSTVVLGGLIRDDIQTINDKVPVLGDIPLLGRMFQSKAIKNTKRNLIIFVSASIYRNDGELLNPPEVADAAAILTGHSGFTPAAVH